MRKRTINFADHSKLVDALRKMNFGDGVATREDIQERCEEIIGREISLSTVTKLCKLLNIKYKGLWGCHKSAQQESLPHRCPACGSRLGVKLYR